MESFEEMNSSKDNLLEPPSINDSSTDEEDVKATIKPRLSPLPKRRSSVSSDDGDLEPPPTVARKVSFADAFGFDLVSVKEFDTWEIPTVTPNFVMESIKIEEFYLTPSFILPPVSTIMERLNANKVTLESMDFIPGTPSMKGIIRVLNLSFEKQVYVRMSLDCWQSHYDLLAEYVPDSCNGETDQFFFTISLVSPYQKEGARVDFCICYETSVGTFWDNNGGHNYVLTCQKKEQIVEIGNQSDEVIDKNKKSCLKPTLSKEDEDAEILQAETPAATEKYIPRIICSHDEFSEDNNDEETADKSKEKEKNKEDESDMQLFLSQRLMNARITSSEEKYSTGHSNEIISPNDQQLNEGIKYLPNTYSEVSEYSQQLEECDYSREYRPINEVIPSGDTKDFSSLLSSADHSEHQGAVTKTHQSLEESEKADIYLQDSGLSEQDKISPVIIDEASHGESCQWSSTEEECEDPISDSCLKFSETPCTVPPDTTQLTEIIEFLDDNANPNYSQSTSTLPHFSTYDTKGIKDEQSKKSETETIEDDTLLLTTKEHTEPKHPMLFLQHEDFQDLLYKCKSSGSSVLEKENTEPNEKVYSIISSGETCLFSEGQVEDKGEEKETENTNIIPSLCKNTKHRYDVTDVSADKQYITTAKEDEFSDSDIVPALSKQYDLTVQGIHLDQIHKKIQVIDDKDVVSKTDDKRSAHRIYCSEKESSVVDCSKAHTTAETVVQGTFHERNAMLGSLPSEQTPEYKVIIAKITEEKGQSQKSVQDRQGNKSSYVDIGKNENVRLQQEIDETSAKNIELPIENTQSVNKEVADFTEKLNTSKIPHLSTEGGCVYNYKSRYGVEHYEGSSEELIRESNAENDAKIIQSSNSFTQLGQDRLLTSKDDMASEKETNDVTDLSHLHKPEDKKCGNVQPNKEEYASPSILISEPDDEGEAQCSDEEHSMFEDLQHYYHHDNTTCPDQQTETGTMPTESIGIGHVKSKVLCFIMFVVFAGLMYHFDFLVCFALYLFSLYWLYWEGGKNKNSVRKE
ncbi:protein phosphatase 1 regulatory subunit 3A [Engystomops pustulosus]|uniref:protein phosphatase 1 regulatory subunit 3A n=1 Tax=Engystomops pustulosus TaxID=76066 RepID=UPI003AFA4E34